MEYFFGTGGLVRAYSDSLLESIKLSKKALQVSGEQYLICMDYSYLEIFKHYCKINEITIISTNFLQDVECNIVLENANKLKFLEDFSQKKLNLKSIKWLSKNFFRKNIINE